MEVKWADLKGWFGKMQSVHSLDVAALRPSDRQIYESIRSALPDSVDGSVLLAATAAARHADINRPDSLERAALTDDGKLWLKGAIPGYRAMVELNGEVADSRQSLAKLSELDDPMVTQLAQTPSQRLG